MLKLIMKILKTKGATVKILSDKRCIIGEGPIWNEFDNKLYYVNAWAGEIHCIDLGTKEDSLCSLGIDVAAMGFTKNGEMLISCDDGAFILNGDNVCVPLYDRAKFEIKDGNDAKVGPDGRFYVGTVSAKRKGVGDAVDGKLYSIDKHGNVRILLDGLLLSNGFDWSMDEKRFYHTDSDTRIIKEYEFDKQSGDIEFTGRELYVPGVDGFTISEADELYIACWGRSYIAVADIRTMTIKEYIEVPTKIPVSCAFAGEDMDKLVITSATLGVDIEKDKNAGYTFIYDTQTRGRKPYLFG